MSSAEFLKNRVPFNGPDVMKGHLDEDEIGMAYGHDGIPQIAEKLDSNQVWEDKKTALLQMLLDEVTTENQKIRLIQHQSLLLILNSFQASKHKKQRVLIAKIFAAIATVPQGKTGLFENGSFSALHALLQDGSEEVRIAAAKAFDVVCDTAEGCGYMEQWNEDENLEAQAEGKQGKDIMFSVLIDSLFDENDGLAYSILRVLEQVTNKDSVIKVLLKLDVVGSVLQFVTQPQKGESGTKGMTAKMRLAAVRCLQNIAVQEDGKEELVDDKALTALSYLLFEPLQSVANELDESHLMVRQAVSGVFMLVATCLNGKSSIMNIGMDGLLSCVLDNDPLIVQNATTALSLVMELPTAKEKMKSMIVDQGIEGTVGKTLGLF